MSQHLYAVGGSDLEKKRKLEKDDPMLVLATHSKDPVPNLAPWKKYIVVLLRTTFAFLLTSWCNLPYVPMESFAHLHKTFGIAFRGNVFR